MTEDNYMTDAYIKLAEKIQDMIEPEEQRRCELSGDTWQVFPEGSAGAVWEGNIKLIYLPSLSWLVRKLRDAGRVLIDQKHISDECICTVWLFGKPESIIEFANTPEMACLQALCRIKGISVD